MGVPMWESKDAGRSVAVVGAGIAGLASAWLLSRHYRVTLFESGSYLGGHTNTVDVTVDGRTFPVDTGFLVFNERTYPQLTALFNHLGVASVATEMTFAASLQQPDLEWAGSNLGTVFGQKRNWGRVRFWAMLRDILRFNRESTAWLAANPDDEHLTLRDYLAEGCYSRAFCDWYLLPMAAAIWSCPPQQMLDMPLLTFVLFCRNHGLLQIFDRPQWRTVKGGGRNYVRHLAADLHDIRRHCPVHAIAREGNALRVLHARGSERFEQVVMACHSDQALEILGATASDGQRAVLAAIRYQPNRAVLHTDRALLPRNSKLWSAWNYIAGQGDSATQPVAVSYLLNKLQPLPCQTPVIVTLNPTYEPHPASIIDEFAYAHPILDSAAIAAQRRLPEIQGQGGIWLAGAWTGYGFHEDGLRSGVAVANRLGVQAPWQVSSLPQLECA